jgi:quinoprotein glucose dehydrogenase
MCIYTGKSARNFLYHTTGDGGAQNAPNGIQRSFPQDPTSTLGKVLRIQIDQATGYTIPKDNMYAQSLDGDPRIYALGMRNPWRCWLNNLPSGDPTQLICGDVGENIWEEINFINLGGNYGWDQITCNKTLYILPKFWYIHPSKVPASQPTPTVVGISVIGGMGYQGPLTELVGNYMFADYLGGIYTLDATLTVPTVIISSNRTPQIISIRINSEGETVYMSQGILQGNNLGPSQIWKITR